MPTMTHNGTTIYYEEHGSGYPLLLFALGGMDSRIDYWRRAPFDPIERLSDQFRVIAMDQRNAGRSFGPVAETGWQEYAADHLALLDHLGIATTHIMGGCIGSSYCLGFMQAAPSRVSAAVLQNPIGLSATNRWMFQGMFDTTATHAETNGMAAVLAAARENPQFTANHAAGPWAYRAVADPAFAAELERMDAAEYAVVSRAYGAKMFGGDFVFSVPESFVRACTIPMLILAGNDDYHPTATAERIAELAPSAELVYRWREPEIVDHTVAKVREFLTRHTP